MNATSMDWKMFILRIAEVLAWPAVTAAALVLLRAPLGRLITALALKLGA